MKYFIMALLGFGLSASASLSRNYTCNAIPFDEQPNHAGPVPVVKLNVRGGEIGTRVFVALQKVPVLQRTTLINIRISRHRMHKNRRIKT